MSCDFSFFSNSTTGERNCTDTDRLSSPGEISPVRYQPPAPAFPPQKKQKNPINKVAFSPTHAASLVLNCAGLMPKGLQSSLSSPALQKGNISPPQVGPQQTRLYLQRASSQHTVIMQKHAHRCTMEYIHTHQRSFVAPVPLRICFFFSVSHP